MFKSHAVCIDQHDAAVAPLSRSFDQPTERRENVRHRVAGSRHFQQVLLSREQSFGPLPVIDVGLDDVPANNISLHIPAGHSTHMKPSINAVSTAHAVLRIVGFPSVDRSIPGSNHRGKIVWVN